MNVCYNSLCSQVPLLVLFVLQGLRRIYSSVAPHVADGMSLQPGVDPHLTNIRHSVSRTHSIKYHFHIRSERTVSPKGPVVETIKQRCRSDCLRSRFGILQHRLHSAYDHLTEVIMNRFLEEPVETQTLSLLMLNQN